MSLKIDAPRFAGLLLAAGCLTGWSQDYTISTIAGDVPAPTPAPATQVSIGRPQGLAMDAAGNLFISADHAVFRMSRAGVLDRVAGTGVAGYSGDGGPAVEAQLNDPRGLALDPAGNLYIAEWRNQVIRKVTPGRIITTAAGIPNPYAAYGFGLGSNGGGDGEPATSVYLDELEGVATDSAGNFYLMEGGRLRKVDRSGTITTVMTVQNTYGAFQGVAVDSTGNIYAVDYGNVYEVSPGGVVTKTPYNGSLANVAVDAAGHIYAATDDCCIRTWNPAGTWTLVAGGGFIGCAACGGYSGDGGPATAAKLFYPWGMVFDSSGNLLIADSNNMRVRVVTSDGNIATVAGSGTDGFSGDSGPAAAAQVSAEGVTLDTQGNLYFADQVNDVAREVESDGTIVTVAGMSGQSGYSGDGGSATSALLSRLIGIASDGGGNLYLADSNRVRKVTPQGIISTIAGNGISGFSGDGGPATAAEIEPWAVAADGAGNVYIGSPGSVRKVSLDGTITTIAPIAAMGAFNSMAIDPSGNIFLADAVGQSPFRLLRITPVGTVSTVAGYPGTDRGRIEFPQGVPISNFTTVGPGGWIGPVYLWGIAFDRAGNIYLSDGCGVFKLLSSGSIVRLTGSCGSYSGEGGPATQASLLGANGIAVDAAGDILFADGPYRGTTGQGSGAIRMLRPPDTALLNVGASIPHRAVSRFHSAQNEFSLIVSNGAALRPTSGPVTVTETPPEGVTLISMTGPGWSCSGNTCTRSDSLAPGASYPAITVTADGVPPKPQPNLALVSGGGSPDFTSQEYNYSYLQPRNNPQNLR